MGVATVAQNGAFYGGYFGNPYLNEYETALIVGLVRGVNTKVMIEFGCQSGRTSNTLLQLVPTLERYIGIDVASDYWPAIAHQRDEMPGEPGVYARHDPRFELMIRRYGTLDLAPHDLPPCDAVFIDGDHSAPAVSHDSALARAIVRPGGIIIWHDYGNRDVEVTQALDALSASGWPICHIAGTWLAYRMM